MAPVTGRQRTLITRKKKKRICLIQTFGMLSWCAAGLLQGRKWLEAPKLNRVSLLVINVPPKKHLAKTKRRLTVKQCRTVWNTIALSKYTKQYLALPSNMLLCLWQLIGIGCPRCSSSHIYHEHIGSKVQMKMVTDFNKKHLIKAGYNHFEGIVAWVRKMS